MELFIILFVLGLLATPIVILIIIFGRLSHLSNRIDENFTADQADKLVLKRALERLRQLEENVQRLSTQTVARDSTSEPSRQPTRAGQSTTPIAAPAVSPPDVLPSDPSAENLAFLREATVQTPAARVTPERVSLSFPDGSAPASPPATEPASLSSIDSVTPASPPKQPSVVVQRPAPRPTTSPSGQALEWEALIGGNILNKLGAFILVIGLALFLYYSLDTFGPMAKLLIGLLLGGGLVVAGVVAERSGSAPMFIRGLLGAGWSALYFTAYAAHGLAATRVIDDPTASVILLMLVAAGMIGHSLRFASEATTGLAFFIAYAGLSIGPEGRFTTFAALLLSAALLGLSFRFAWSRMVVFGTFAAYGFHLFHPAYPLGSAEFEILVFNQLLLSAYWLGFESFGIIQPFRFATSSTQRGLLFILNALGFTVCSLAFWPTSLQIYQYGLWGVMAVLYLTSGYLRHAVFPPRPVEESEIEAAWAPSPDAVFCLASAAALMLFWSKIPATLIAIAWGILCLIHLEVGLRWKFPYLRKMGHFIGLLAFGRLFFSNFTTEGHTSGISHRLLTVLPMIALYFQVFMRCAEDGESSSSSDMERTFTRVYLYLPVILLVALARFELGRGLATPVWAAVALGLQLIGTRWKLVDFRRQSVILAGLTAMHGWGTDLRGLEANGLFAEPLFIGILTILGLFICQAVAPREEIRRVQEFEGAPTGIGDVLENQGRLLFSLTGSFVLAFLLYLKISGSLLSLAWAFTGTLLLIMGFMLREKPSRYTGLMLIAICLVKLFFYDLQYLEIPYKILSFAMLGLILMGISWVYSRFQDKIREYL